MRCSDAIEFVAGHACQISARGQNDAKKVAWPDLVKQAWLERVGLSQTGFYMTPEIKYDFMTLQGKAFYYYCYGAARDRSGD
jgi:xanthine dehydrogenase molybdopterin-binding subunit B